MDKHGNFTSLVLPENKKISIGNKIKKVKDLKINEIVTPSKLQVINIIDSLFINSKYFFNKVVYNDKTSFFLKDWEKNNENFQESATKNHIFMVKKVFNGIRIIDIWGNMKYISNIDMGKEDIFINEHFGGKKIKNNFLKLR